MVEIEVMPCAEEDIKNIIEYVLEHSVQNAEKLYIDFFKKIFSLQKFPQRGKVVKEIANLQIREIKLHRFRIIYRLGNKKVQILTVHHSAKLLDNNAHLKDLFD
jgi:toxin ParE1/3/4